MPEPSIPPDVAARRARMERLASASTEGQRHKAPFTPGPSRSPSLYFVWVRLLCTGAILIGVVFLLIFLARLFLGFLRGMGFSASA